ncbi:MAG TPA: FMN-binding negative transcriptional regulator [Vicinamibacterales bacterium]|jgi:transcriptional regulator
MFVRSSWKPRTNDEMFDLIDAHPWARLVTNGEHGPLATNLPLLLDRRRGRFGLLVGHLARANAHAQALAAAQAPTLAIFEGPYTYVTPSWYPGRDMPSTYYYTAVHCYGHVRLQSDAELEASLGTLVARMEAPIPNGWSLGEIPRSEVTRRLPAIVGFELEIERLEGKFKLGQDEPRRDALAVAGRLDEGTEPSLRELADLIRHYNMDRPDANPV